MKRMRERYDNKIKDTENDNETLEKLKKKDGYKYEVILKGGHYLLKALKKLYKVACEVEIIPDI